MHGKVKLTKREIKEDKFATFMLTAKDQMSENWQYAAIGVAALVLAVAAVIFFITNQKSNRVEAAAKFSEAQMQYRSGNTQVATMTLNQLVEDYGGSVGENALFLLARINYEQKNYPEAIRFWEQYASEHKDNKLNYSAALAGIAASYENQGQFADAASKYGEAIAAYPDGPAIADYNLGMMRSYLEVGDIEKARINLNELKTKFANSEVANRAIRLFTEKDPTASQT